MRTREGGGGGLRKVFWGMGLTGSADCFQHGLNPKLYLYSHTFGWDCLFFFQLFSFFFFSILA